MLARLTLIQNTPHELAQNELVIALTTVAPRSLKELVVSRIELTKARISEAQASISITTLRDRIAGCMSEARNAHDRIFKEIQENYFPNSARVHFPYIKAPAGKTCGSKTPGDLVEATKKVKEKLDWFKFKTDSHVMSSNFVIFFARRTEIYDSTYSFAHQVKALVDDHKHNKSLATEMKEEQVNEYYRWAHEMAILAEEIVRYVEHGIRKGTLVEMCEKPVAVPQPVVEEEPASKKQQKKKKKEQTKICCSCKGRAVKYGAWICNALV